MQAWWRNNKLLRESCSRPVVVVEVVVVHWAGLEERSNATTAGCLGVRPDMRPGSVVENESWR